jgi:Asp-tRNA(Asn)/Glu-tRNA(Gln) amidotransferase A subunit family amidase
MRKGEVAKFLDHESTIDTYLQRIREHDQRILAWTLVHPQPPLGKGALEGMPFGVKDIFDTAGVGTEYGSALFAGRVPDSDAGLVRVLRDLGGVVLGKTHTTAFAYFDPAPTRNPHDPEHTPGGSSSGSAAAVAAGMVPFALGSQTQGSVCRPASFCGVAGFKPTHGLISMDGVLPFAPTLDTAGFFTQTAADMLTLWERIGYSLPRGSRLRICAFPVPDTVEEEMRATFRTHAERLDARPIACPESFREIHTTVKLIQDTEGARTLRETYEKHGAAIGTKLAEMIERGLATSEEDYLAGLDQLAQCRRDMQQVFAQYDIVLTPAALGPAPATLASTGDPRMNSPWTGLGGPSLSIPMRTPGLPLGLQMAAARGNESLLLAAACAAETAFIVER